MEIYNDERHEYAKKARIVDSKAMNLFKVYSIFAIAILITGIMAFAWPYVISSFYQTSEAALQAYLNSVIVFAIILIVSSFAQMFAALSRNSWVIGSLFTIYAISMGGLISSFTLFYDINDIFISFLVTGGLFFIMGMIGVFSKGKISKAVSFVSTLIIGVLILSLINIFIKSSAIYWVVSIAIFIFYLVFAAFDIYRVERLADQRAFSTSNALCLYCAYCLYTDFVMIFIYVLRFMSMFSRRD